MGGKEARHGREDGHGPFQHQQEGSPHHREEGALPACPNKPCLTGCPAENYTWDEATNELVYNYEGCLECGCCRFVCPLDAIEWSYPRGGFGVAYKWG